MALEKRNDASASKNGSVGETVNGNQFFKADNFASLTQSGINIDTGADQPENIRKLVEEVSELYEKNNVPVKVHTFKRLSTVSHVRNGNIYATLVYPVGERDCVTSSQILEAVRNNKDVSLVDAAIEKDYKHIQLILASEIAKKHGYEFDPSKNKMIVVKQQIDEAIEVTPRVIGLKARMWAEVPFLIAKKDAGEQIEPNIPEVTKGFEKIGKKFALDLFNLGSGVTDTNGRPIEATYTVELTEKTKGSELGGYLDNNSPIVVSFGNIQSAPIKLEPQTTTYGYQAAPMQALQCYGRIIVLEMVESAKMTLGYTMLGLGVQAALTKNNNWMKPLEANLERLGTMAKFYNGPVEKGMTPQQIAIHMHSHVPALVAVDVPINTDVIPAYQPIVAAADGNIGSNGLIAKTLDEMFGNTFTSIFKGKIFSMTTVMPTGYFFEDGQRVSIDKILDPAYIISKKPKEYMAFFDDIGDILTGEADDTFMLFLKVLNGLGIDATITGSKRRCYMNPEAFSALIESMKVSGITPEFEFQSFDWVERNGLVHAGNAFMKMGIGQVGFEGRTANVGNIHYGGVMY